MTQIEKEKNTKLQNLPQNISLKPHVVYRYTEVIFSDKRKKTP